jgi:2-desacetyl-2-hydroxyethyl bacteriochlorophyllide A dehydrogenase
MNMKSLYIVFPEKGKVEVREESVTPPGPGQVMCAAVKSLLSIGDELFCLRGEFDPGTAWESWVKYPFCPGHSMAARVVAVGKGVTGFKEGDRVAVITSHQQFFKIRPEEAYLLPGAISYEVAPLDQVSLPLEGKAYLLPEAISYEEGTWMLLAVTCQIGVRRADLDLGETVGVVGLGILGQLVVQYLAVSGARKIIAIDPVQRRLDMAKAHGATHILAMDVQSAREEIAKITQGKMLDVVFDVTGNAATLASAILLLRRLGRLILLGSAPNPTQQCLGGWMLHNSISILGAHASMSPKYASEFNPWTRQEMTGLFFDYLIQGRMNVADLITHRYSPLNAPQVYEGLVRDRSAAIGVIFDWNLL